MTEEQLRDSKPAPHRRGEKKQLKDAKAHQAARRTRRELKEAVRGPVDPGPEPEKGRLERIRAAANEEVLEARFSASGPGCMAPDLGRSLQLPPTLWSRIVDDELSIEEWKLAFEDNEDPSFRPATDDAAKVAARDKEMLHRLYWKSSYEDEYTMTLILDAYKLGVAEGMKMQCGAEVLTQRNAKRISALRKVVGFLMQDFNKNPHPVLELSPSEVLDRIADYFEECEILKKTPTVPAMAFRIGFATRQELVDFVKEDTTATSYFIKRAITYIECDRIEDMLNGTGLMVGHKLDLATNFNYADPGAKKGSGETPPAQITINNNTLSMNGAPPRFENMEEWQKWYLEEEARRKAEAQPSVTALPVQGAIDVPVQDQ